MTFASGICCQPGQAHFPSKEGLLIQVVSLLQPGVTYAQNRAAKIWARGQQGKTCQNKKFHLMGKKIGGRMGREQELGLGREGCMVAVQLQYYQRITFKIL